MLLMRAYKKDNEVAVIDEDYSNNVTAMMVYITGVNKNKSFSITYSTLHKYWKEIDYITEKKKTGKLF